MSPSGISGKPRNAAGPNRRAATLRPRACVLALAVAFANPAGAAPTGAAVMAGQASIVTNGNLTTITNSNGAVINWRSFSIGRDEITRFVQPSAASSVLNRVVGGDPSFILGQLQSNGRVFLVNPAGIMVGAGARIDVGGFVASSLNLRTEDFLANRLNFQATPGAGAVRNEGVINTPQGGQVFLVAPRVENAGTINAPGGEVALAAGRTVQIGDTAAPGVRIEVAGGESAANLGSVTAEAGRIGLFGALVRNSGALNASSAVAEGGRILLKATGTTLVDGDASLNAAGTRGGRIEVLGDQVAVADRATLDASGRAAGGTVLVGGDYQGKNADVQNARVTWVGPQAAIRADATESGDGGKVVVWSDDTTRAYGSISARGGAQGGNGGLIETSGKRFLDVEGIRVNASAAGGRAGTWLLDPEELRIVENGSPGTDTNTTAGPNFTPAVSTALATLSADTLRNALNANSNVTVTTSSSGTGTGDIIFDASSAPIILAKTGNTFASNLDINAYRNVKFIGGATTFRTTAGAGNQTLSVNLNAGTGNSVGDANVFTDAGATVNLDATTTAGVGIAVGNGKIWINNGTVNLGGLSTIKLPTQVNPFPTPTLMPATFRNNGTFNNASTAGWFITSNISLQDGKFDNFGTLNTGGGSVEGIFNNNPGAVLKLLGGNTLSLQNAHLMSGTVNIVDPVGTLWISEYHGTVARFHDTLGLGAGKILVRPGVSPQADFQRFTGGGLTLQVDSGGLVTMTDGTNLFADLVAAIGSSTTVNNATIAFSGNFIHPVTGLNYTGDARVAAAGNLSLTAGSISGANNFSMGAGGILSIASSIINATGTVSLGAGSKVAVSGGSIGTTASGGTSINSGGLIDVTGGAFIGSSTTPLTLAAGAVSITGSNVLGNLTTVIANNLKVGAGGQLIGTDKLRALIAGNILLDASSGNSSLFAGNDLNLALASSDSVLDLAGSPGHQALVKVTNAGGAIRVLFTQRAADGIMVDGVPGIGPGIFNSRFAGNTGPAVLGSNLFVTYGGSRIADLLTKESATGESTVRRGPITKEVIDPNRGDVLSTKQVDDKSLKDKNDKERDPLNKFGSDDKSKDKQRPGSCKAA